MASTFKGINLFGPGPHRFSRGRRGQLLVSDFEFGSFTPKSYPVGLVEVEVTVRGRLVAASESALWSQRDAILDQLTDPPAKGLLVDHHGHQDADMSFVRFEEGPGTDRGRTWSLAYVARFRRLLE
ncbi:MAG TPA: hypothetical protein VK176_03870 [Phycisphaerales bacterium]|nr:hypothetical protein [Phycisphaerales bacterium]